MLLRRFTPRPVYVPAVGETVMARCSPVSPFTRAVVTSVRPSRDTRKMRIFFRWLESNDATLTPARAGARASLIAWRDGGGAVMVHPLPEAPTAHTPGGSA